jgi:hypothetical protein
VGNGPEGVVKAIAALPPAAEDLVLLGRRTHQAGDGNRRNWMYELVARNVLRLKLTKL